MDKQNVVYTYNRKVFIFGKEWNSDICYNMGEPGEYGMLWNKEVTKRQTVNNSTYISNRQ